MGDETDQSAGRVERASAWIYSGLWAALTSVFLVPREPPRMPSGAHEVIGSFRPAPGYLRYVKLYFWIGLLGIDIVLTLAWLGITIALPIVGAILALPVLVLVVLPDVFAYIAIHLRYDTTWYVLTDRSVRLRRGVMVLKETTITYENVQNVTVHQGPIQRYFGIADLVVQTAGGGGGHPQHGGGVGHLGRIEGVDNAQHIRDLIMTRARASRSAGLGDDHHDHSAAVGSASAGHASGAEWSRAQLDMLRQIRDLLPPMA
ncbi:MAG: PH domain-containing protein [Phycisphaerales bacterium]